MVLIVVAAAIVVGVIVVALGRGGGLAQSTADFVPFEIDNVTATDVALLRPPQALCGYHIPATDQALSRIAQAMTELEVEIATLRRQLAELRSTATAAAARGQQPAPGQPPPGQPPPGQPPAVAGPPDTAASAAATPAGSGAPLPSRPSVWRRELAEPADVPAADPWPPLDPWSAWERAGRPAADQDQASEPARDPPSDTDPGPPGEAR